MRKWLWILLFFSSGFFFFAGYDAKAAVNQDGSVTIDANNFPDSWFREAVTHCDENRDGSLSGEERKKIGEIAVTVADGKMNSEGVLSEGVTLCYDIRKSEPKRKKLEIWVSSPQLSLEGIGCFENLTDLSIRGFEKVSGSVKANKKLVNVVLAGNTDETGEYGEISQVKEMLPLKQLRSLSIEGTHFRKFALPEAVNLLKLTMTGVEIGKTDLSRQKELKVIELHEAEIGSLDLRKNKKLWKIAVTSGVLKQDYDTQRGREEKEKKAGSPYYDHGGVSCRLLLPEVNRIKELTYVTADRQVDLSQCKKLTSLHVREGVKVKLSGKKYKKIKKNTFRFITVSGEKGKQLQIKRQGKYLYVTGKKNWKYRRTDVVSPWA